MQEGHLLVLVVASLAVTAVCRRRGWPAPLVLVGVGLVVSTIPGFPEIEIDGDTVLAIVLPPLLSSAALRCSYTGFRDSIGAISALGVGLVVVTTGAVGLAAYLIVPDMPLSVAFVLGAVVAPPDAVAATSVGKRLGLPRRIVMILTGESLINGCRGCAPGAGLCSKRPCPTPPSSTPPSRPSSGSRSRREVRASRPTR